MSDERRRERDLVLAPNEYAYLLDETKGNIINYVGPHKTSLANTDQPVAFNHDSKRFERCTLEQAIHPFAVAPEGWYLVLKNPAQEDKLARSGTANSLPELNIGRKVNIPGPTALAPWPGQMVRVIQGHRLRSNQYLIVRVYDEEGARANWSAAVIKPQTPAEEATATEVAEAATGGSDAAMPDLTMGKLLVIKGTEVSFYIPPTGIEVIVDRHGRYVRDAVTLERLEYCILLDEDGNKRYIQGPDVVFPRPTERFVSRGGRVKFRAIELNEISGLYLKVIAPYEEDGQSYNVGDELFITGREQMIYFPRPEQAIIRYNGHEINHAVAIPAGEARYVLDRLSGQIGLERGPSMFLPDPRRQVIVRRILDPETVRLWFPGNQEALNYNQRLRAMVRRQEEQGFVPEPAAKSRQGASEEAATVEPAASPAEAFDRQQFSPPRTITLNTKYEGAVAIDVWTGYAVQVIGKSGERRVIVGPQSYLLEYDEMLGVVELSTGTPKSDQNLLKSVYLRALNNKISDRLLVETRDACQVSLHLSYRVNFEGEPNRWFNVENYVKFLTDHLRSLLHHTVRQLEIEPFYANAIELIRDAVLGTADQGVRPGRHFPENGMHIYDVEVLAVEIEDPDIAELLLEAKHETVRQSLQLAILQRNLAVTQETEAINRQKAEAVSETALRELDLKIEQTQAKMNLQLAQLETDVTTQQQRLAAQQENQVVLEAINKAELARQRAQHDLALAVSQEKMVQRLQELQAEVDAVVAKAGAVSPQLVAALQEFADKALAERMAESMAPLAILGGKSIADVFAQLLKGTTLEQVIRQPVMNGS